MSTKTGWMLLCLGYAWMIQPPALPARHPAAHPIHRPIALKAEAPGALPWLVPKGPEDTLRLAPAGLGVPLPPDFAPGLTPGCRF
jgi:hypothetical protein